MREIVPVFSKSARVLDMTYISSENGAASPSFLHFGAAIRILR